MTLEYLCLHCRQIQTADEIDRGYAFVCSYCGHTDFWERQAREEFNRDAMQTIGGT